ncbi:fatty acid synthase subunit beta [Alcanivorax sp. 521-1]|uniref:Fatty acid synthase subunit beta n=1 Tax=Alloalcanivorax profundimaris TaxID=2735259 RepID=A0ABS0AVA7_9GAMM|nr:MaoC/PaaZ C-terminal domain-containing protein [Alloalcanivorax profundimaris]MBF5058047.1 fatty acid synthase subunit beta [Alloalcanivorax profundimaris]
MKAPAFKEVNVGDVLPDFKQFYGQDAIDHYAVASFDMNPVHTNPAWSSRAQVFGMPETVGHGMMTASTMVTAVTTAWGAMTGTGGFVKFVHAKFTKPVKVGSTVTTKAKVKKKHFHGPGKDYVTILVEAFDDSGDLIGLAEVGYNLP